MKMYRLLLVFICLLASAQLYAQKEPTITLSLKNVPLETVITQIKKQTGIQIFYDLDILKKAGRVSITVKEANLRTALNQCLLNTPVGYNLVGGKIVVLIDKTQPKDDDGKPAINMNAFSKGTVHGFVYNTQGQGLANANVIIKRSHQGTITNAKGEFILENVRTNDTLSISYIGYKRQEMAVSLQTEFSIYMKEADNELDAVMVQAYGTTTKRLSVGEITQINAAQLEKQPVTNVLLALQGMVPGMIVSPTSGFSGAPVKVEIRGRNSIANVPSDPLYVIDGVPLIIPNLGLAFSGDYANGSAGLIQSGLSFSKGQSPLYSLNMQDIESVSVLVDGAATARYGSRAGNGVIMITTKKGKQGTTQFTVDVDRSVDRAIGHWDMLNTSQYLQMRREAFSNDGITPTIENAPDLILWDANRNTDWQKELWQSNISTGVSTSLSGGNNITTFRLGASYSAIQNMSALSNQNKNDKGGLNFNLGYKSLNQKLSLSFTATYAYTTTNQVFVGGATTLPPNLPPIFDEEGNLNYGPFNYSPGSGIIFPFSGLLSPSTASTYTLSSGMTIAYKIVKGLDFNISMGYNNSSAKNKFFQPIAAQNPIDYPLGTAIFGNNGNIGYNVNPFVAYSGYIGKGNLKISMGATLNNTTAEGYTLMGAGYSGDELLKSINNAPFKTITQRYLQNKYIDVNANINYNWERKYIIELTGNRSGSSSFGPGKQFGNFWSAGVNWFPLEEKWLKGVIPTWISLIKLNSNYGITGLSGGDYKYLSQWSSGSASPLYYYNGNLPLVPINAVNQDYHWQSVKKLSASLSLGFLEDKFNLSASVYKNNCDNQLTNLPTPQFTGFNSVFGNSAANLQNTGVTASLSGNIITEKDFSWSASFNISRNRNKLLAYPGIEYTADYSRIRIGESMSAMYLLHYLGVDPQTGRRAFQDYNNDGKISNYAPGTPPGLGTDDRRIVVDLSPEFNGGAVTDLNYKNLAVSLGFTFEKRIVQRAYTGGSPGAVGNVPVTAFSNYWKRPGDIAINPILTTNPGVSESLFGSSDGGYTDGSYLRLSNISARYYLAEKFAQKLGAKQLSVSLNVQNIFTLTKYDGIDPQLPFGEYPQPRTFNFRLSITL
ncbi:MAG: SusC/RagA family TonB-linked outer membrane protein [Pedobacter sp.]|uniref:SusC/RagA family TonB-linked outer membrane protein n=1 Tax=Pedobacter sp. TaxID=1411316 RepID=UPI00356B4FC8